MSKSISMATAAAMAALLLQGCSYPIESARVVDNRPALSFKTSADPDTLSVTVDGIANGRVCDYLEGKAALRVLPGTHTITIIRQDGTTSSQRVYVSDGVRKTLIVQ